MERDRKNKAAALAKQQAIAATKEQKVRETEAKKLLEQKKLIKTQATAEKLK